MKFCPSCSRVLVRQVVGDNITFQCPTCGETVKPSADDSLIFRPTGQKEDASILYQGIIRSAARDRVNAQVAKECPECGLDYMTLIRVGQEESVIFKCKCGKEIRS